MHSFFQKNIQSQQFKKWQLFLMPLLGTANIFAFIPYEYFLIPFFTTPLLMYAIYKSTSKSRSFLTGWMYGFGFLGAGLYWFNNALLTDAESFGWLFPIAIIVIPLVVGLYYGVFGYVTHCLKIQSPIHFYFNFCFMWVVFEICRTYLFSGFPWLAFGYIYGFDINLAQTASLFGIFGMSLFIVLSYGILFLVTNQPSKATNFVIISVFMFNLCFYFYGVKRLEHRDTIQPNTIRIIQPNIQKFHSWDNKEKQVYLDLLLNMSTTNLPISTSYIIWPEIPTPLNLFKTQIVQKIRNQLPYNVTLISNTLRFTYRHIFNSSIFLKNGYVISYYDKSRLVPFGEYIPFRSFLPLAKITEGSVDFTPGLGLQTINLDKDKMMPLICFESFFPISYKIQNRPNLLINLTNDAWYGETQGPYLHYQMTQFRAIESNIPLVRAANTGISAMFDSRGRIVKKLHLNEQGYLDLNHIKSDDKETIHEKYLSLQLLIFTIIMILIYVKNLKICLNVYRNEKH